MQMAIAIMNVSVTTQYSLINPLTPAVHEKVMHTSTNLQLKAVGLFN